MTIDERVEGLIPRLYDNNETGLVEAREMLRSALLETAHDQQHADAEVLTTCRKLVMGSKQRVFIEYDEAHQAVMNAEIK